MYFGQVKKKISKILLPIFSDEHSDKMFRSDDDLTRILAPIAGSIFYIYLTTRDVNKTIETCLILDNIFIQFFIISYMILDNLMDEVDDSEKVNSKKIFFKMFMKIVNNPEIDINLNDNELSIWQCIIFKKYFLLFVIKYPPSENKIIYDFVKVMISTINNAGIIQKNKDSSEDDILEHTFKKSYVVSFFMALLINIQLKFNIDTEIMSNLCKLLFLVQIYDDYFDIDKDVIENNYTYFNSSDHPSLNFDDKIRKTVLATFIFIDEINEKNNNISNIINYIMKNVILLVFYIQNKKINRCLTDYFLEYSIFSENNLRLFDKSSYDQFNSNIITKMIQLYYN